MVLAEAMAGIAGGTSALWGYNRSNFFFDREMRQKQEYQVVEWRSRQAELWRQDVRDLVGLTEKKMDSYLIVTVLQLGMCVALFAEGRLEPGTPPWLLHFYMLTLGAAFMYMLMAAFFAMHTSVVAQSNLVRLMTQLVRLPVPSWEELEEMRTYAQSFEAVEAKRVLRLPFLGSMRQRHDGDGASSVGASTPAKSRPARGEDLDTDDLERTAGASPKSSPGAADRPDPWGLERHGAHLYELHCKPVPAMRHIALVRQAAQRYQCFDAFTRVAMTFGTNQLLYAMSYYSLGYASVQDGAPVGAWCVVAVMVGTAMTMVELDISLTKMEQTMARMLVLAGPLCASCATFAWNFHSTEAEALLSAMLPITYASHGFWLICALNMCGVHEQGNGGMMPMNFRAVLYLDVFGWLSTETKLPMPGAGGEEALYTPMARGSCTAYNDSQEVASFHAAGSKAQGAEEFSFLSSPLSKVPQQSPVKTPSKSPSRFWSRSAAGASPASPKLQRKLFDDKSEFQHMCCEPQRCSDRGDLFYGVGPTSATPVATSETFHPMTFFSDGDARPGDDIVTGHGRMPAGRVPWTMFRAATLVLVALWALGLVFSFGLLDEFSVRPLGEEGEGEGQGAEPKHKQVDPGSGDAILSPLAEKADWEHLPPLPEGELINVQWPSHAGFAPLALSCDPVGKRLAVADDFGVYAGHLVETQPSPHSRRLEADAGATIPPHRSARGLRDAPPARVLTASFARVPPCAALEGQALKDIGVVCPKRAGSACRVLVLHRRGESLSECPLEHPMGQAAGGAAAASGARASRANSTWLISRNWLRGKRENVESFAVDSQCLRDIARERESTFVPNQEGCVLVGTTSGRVVQLRQHTSARRQLVPSWAVQQQPGAVSGNSIHIFPGGVVLALRREAGSVQAFDARRGDALGEWRLPRGVQWLTLSGGGDSLYMLGRKNTSSNTQADVAKDDIKLWSFPMPPELRARQKAGRPVRRGRRRRRAPRGTYDGQTV